MSTLQTRGTGGRVAIATAVVAMGVLLLGMWVLEAVDTASDNSLDPYGISPADRRGPGRHLHRAVAAPRVGAPDRQLDPVPPPRHPGPARRLAPLGVGDAHHRHRLRARRLALLAPGSITVGASGIVFGWLTYLLVRGFYSRSLVQIGIGIVVFVVYGGILWGVLPGEHRDLVAGPPGRGCGRCAGRLVAAAGGRAERRADAPDDGGSPGVRPHEHHKPRPHYDLRLEEDGVLRSWAVPKGMPATHHQDRLAVAVDDHDLDHATYTDADKEIADTGWWELEDRSDKRFVFVLHGTSGSHRYALIDTGRDWLLHRTKRQPVTRTEPTR